MAAPPWTDRIQPQIHVCWSGPWSADTVEPARVLIDHELVVVGEGRCRVVIGREAFDLGKGGFIIVPPGVVHHSHAVAGSCVRHCLHFDWERRDDPLPSPLWSFTRAGPPAHRLRLAPAWVPAQVLHGTASPVAIALAQRACLRWRSGDPAARATALDLLLTLFAAQKAPVADRTATLALLVKERLDRGGLDEVSLRSELRRLGHSYEHLCRCFTRAMGIPPLRYLQLARIERAKALLDGGDHPVAEVARLLGYRDARHFAQLFRSLAGTSPGRWRGQGAPVR